MKIDVKIPGVGESITEGTLASWSVADGSAVIEGQALFEMETDKTTIDVTAPATGTLIIGVPEGTDVVIDQIVAVIDTESARKGSENPETNSPEKKNETETAADHSGNASDTISGEKDIPVSGRITPAAKAAAADAGINPAELRGSGRDGMVTKSDVRTAVGEKSSSAGIGAPASSEVPGSEAPSPTEKQDSGMAGKSEAEGQSSAGKEIRKPLSRIRKVIAANLKRTQEELVLLTTFNEADMTAIKAMRVRYGDAFKKRHGVKLGFMSFFLKASSAALEAFPEVNARIEENEVVYPDGVHISVAVSTPKGLVTPVLRHVEGMSFADIEKKILEFSRKALDKTLMPDDMIGGSFTVTNGGIFGSMMSTPLPAPGQSAILGMHAINDRPVALEGEVHIRPMMYLALSYDHRLVDGREAVGCLKMIKEALEHPERLLLEL